MKEYMGYRAPGNMEPDTARTLPKIQIEGTDFWVDIAKHELREVSDPYNRFSMGDVKEEMGFSYFLYDTNTKNLHLHQDIADVPDHVRIVLLPPLKDIDPIGLAARQGRISAQYQQQATPVKLTTFGKQKHDENEKPRVQTKRRSLGKGI